MMPSGPIGERVAVQGLSLRCVRAPVSDYTTLRTGGVALVYEPERIDDVGPALVVGQRMPLWFLGGGSNLLAPDEGLPGLVLSARKLLGIEREGRELVVRAGTPLQTLVRAAYRAGLSGLEPLVGIPAQVGGAVAMNCGSGGFEIADRLARVRLVLPSGSDRWMRVRREQFGYRSSPFPGAFVAEARLRLDPADPRAIYDRMVEHGLRKARTQPLAEPSAGCIFRNPPGDAAGSLLDRAGVKGLSIGGARFSERHANFIVTRPGARSADVLRLIEHARERVLESFDVLLQTEVVFWRREEPVPARAAG